MPRSLRRLTRLALLGWLGTATTVTAQDKLTIDGQVVYEATGDATADTLDAAKDAAIAAARSRLLLFRKARIESKLEQQWKETIEGNKGTYREVATGNVKSTAAGELHGSVVVEASAVQQGKQFVGTARVRCSERRLLPHRRLEDLELRTDATPEAYLRLADDYGLDEPELGVLTLRLGWARLSNARLADALAVKLAHARHDGEALHFAGEALRRAGDDTALRERVESLRREINARVPSVDELARDVIAAARRRASGTRATFEQVTATEGSLAWPCKLGTDERIVKTFVDRDLTPHWRTRVDGNGPFEPGTDVKWSFDWPPADTGVEHVCVLWRVPVKTWTEIEAQTNVSRAREGECPEGERVVLRDLLRRLESEALEVAVCVLPAR